MSNKANTTVGQTADAVAPPPPRKRRWADTWREFKQAPWSAQFGFVVILTYVLVALLAP